jgi:hypothetical protein
MIIKSKRNSKYIRNLEDKIAREITVVFNKMLNKFQAVAGMVLQKNNGGNPIDILVALGFEEISKILEDGSLITYAYAYKDIANGVGFEINLERVNKQALKVISERQVFYGEMEKYTRQQLALNLEKALKENISYEEYLKKSEDIFITSAKRARRIAINEIGSVYVESTKNAVRDAQLETGAKVKKRWNTVGDGKVTAGCRYNENLGYVSTDYYYQDTDGLGGGDMPPRFVGCRCALDYDVE